MRQLLLALLFLILSLGAYAADTSIPYYVPPQQLNALMLVMDSGFSNVFGLFHTATGSFNYDEANKSISNLRVAIDSTSIITANQDSQRNLATLLGAFQYPEIRITSPDSVTFTDGKAQVKAMLTLHGVSKPINLDAVLNKVGKAPASGGMFSSEGQAVGIALRGGFKRADFNITDNPELPSRYGDVIALDIEMQAMRQ
ncbi:MAG TPA: YceI family protein [Alphaproteobacteria bacterium]|nr:YceI family protein [Alphaproteobacteria bacterium]